MESTPGRRRSDFHQEAAIGLAASSPIGLLRRPGSARGQPDIAEKIGAAPAKSEAARLAVRGSQCAGRDGLGHALIADAMTARFAGADPSRNQHKIPDKKSSADPWGDVRPAKGEQQ